MFRGLRIVAIVAIAAVAVMAAGACPSRAADAPTLAPEVKDRLMALAPLRGPAIDRAVFDGKPVLVKFFASW